MKKTLTGLGMSLLLSSATLGQNAPLKKPASDTLCKTTIFSNRLFLTTSIPRRMHGIIQNPISPDILSVFTAPYIATSWSTSKLLQVQPDQEHVNHIYMKNTIHLPHLVPFVEGITTSVNHVLTTNKNPESHVKFGLVFPQIYGINPQVNYGLELNPKYQGTVNSIEASFVFPLFSHKKKK